MYIFIRFCYRVYKGVGSGVGCVFCLYYKREIEIDEVWGPALFWVNKNVELR